MQPEVELSSTPNLLRKRSQQTACYPDGSTRDYVVGEPDLEKVIAMSHQYLPRYIYRVYSDASPGTNNKNGFSAHALLSSDRVKIEDMPQRQTRYIIDYHLRWLKHKRAWQSRLISVTSSLLFALQVAVHKRYKRIEHKKKAKRLNAKLQIARDKNHTSKIEDLQEEIRLHGQKPKDTNIFICILDTSTIPEDTAIYQANILAEAYENGDDIGLQKSYYIAELFVWESLQGDSSHVNFDELIKGGFLDLLSGYTESPNSLQLQVKRMRKELSSTRRTRHSVPADHFRMALAMAECFQAPFQLPMIIGFLSLASGRYTDGSVLAKITETIKGITQPNPFF